MQSYVPISASDTLNDGPAVINQNDQTILSCNSGPAFPTANLQVGMLCYRTDQKKLYQLTDTSPTWVLLLDLSTGAGAGASALMGGGVAWQVATGQGSTWGAAIPRIASDGGCEIGQYLDFHTASNDSGDNAVRLAATSGALTCTGAFTANGVLYGPAGADVTTPNNGTTGGYRLRANPTSGKAFFQITDSAAGAQWGVWTYTNGAATWSSALTVGGGLTASSLNLGGGAAFAGGLTTGGQVATAGTGSFIVCGTTGGAYNTSSDGLGYVAMGPGDASVTGFLGFWSATGARQGYLGNATTGGALAFYSDSGAGFAFQNGNVSMPSFTITSDARLKTDIAPMSDFSWLIDRTNTYEYTKNGQREWGVIAQEVQDLAPLLVTTGSDGYLEVNYMGYVAALIAEVRRLRERVGALEVGRP